MFGLDNTLYTPIGKSWKSYGVYENFQRDTTFPVRRKHSYQGYKFLSYKLLNYHL